MTIWIISRSLATYGSINWNITYTIAELNMSTVLLYNKNSAVKPQTILNNVIFIKRWESNAGIPIITFLNFF